MVSTLGDDADKLRSVFDVLDSEGSGFISVERFVDVASEHFCNSDLDANGHEAITNIIRALDPTHKGQIQFTQFCEGIRKFLELTGTVTPTDSNPNNFNFRSLSDDIEDGPLIDFDNAVEGDTITPTHVASTDSIEARLSPINLWSTSTPSEQHHHRRTGSTGYRPQASYADDDGDSGFGKLSDHYDQNGRYTASEEHNTEYLSEELNTEYLSEESSASDVLDPDGTSSSTPRGHNLSTMTNGNRLTPSAIASSLYRSSNHALQTPLDSSRHSSLSEIGYDDVEGSLVELTTKVKQLENRIEEMNEDQARSDKKQEKLKEENVQLIQRVHVLEEQLRDVEVKAKEEITEEQRKHKEVLSRTEKDKSREIEILSQSLQHIELECTSLRQEAPFLRSENERLRKDVIRKDMELEALQQQLSTTLDEYKALQDHTHSEQTKLTKERAVHMQLVDELSKELDELRCSKAELLARSPSDRNSEMSSGHRRLIEEQISRLKSENASLREQTDELQAQLLHRHVIEGQQLLLSSAAGSLAAELGNVSHDELKEMISKEREVNGKLRDYIERLTLRILDKNPSILEIGSK